MEKRHIVNLKGKDFVTYGGLLDEGHKKGLVGIRTRIVQLPDPNNANTAVVTAEVTIREGDQEKVFTGIGDANPKNVNTMIALHLIRMAETRAKARALRDATNIDMVSIEELADFDEVIEDRKPAKPPVTEMKATQEQILEVEKEMNRLKMDTKSGQAMLQTMFKKSSRAQLTRSEIQSLIEELKRR